MKQFVKSSYKGDMVEDFFHGKGTYTFEDGTKYEGEFYKGHFHGKGKIIYENGNWVDGEWENGILKNKKLFFSDGLEYNEDNWDYCIGNDRRFYHERLTEIKPLDQTLFSNDPNGLKEIMPGHYGYLTRHTKWGFRPIKKSQVQL